MTSNATTLPADSIFPVRIDQRRAASYRDARQSATLQCRNVSHVNADVGQAAHLAVTIATHGASRTREASITFALTDDQCRALSAELLAYVRPVDDIASEYRALASLPDARLFPNALAALASLMTIHHKGRP